MKEIKLKDIYNLIIIGEYSRETIKHSIAKALNRVVEMESSYLNVLRLRVLMENNKYEYLTVLFDKINGVYIVTISYEVAGKLVYDKEVFEKEPTVIYELCEGIHGLLWVDKFKIDCTSELFNATYFINYPSDSIKYQLINHAIKEMDFKEPKEILVFSELIEKNKELISRVLS